jgi:hypothetical protein
MREFSSFRARVHTISTLGFLLAALLAGCGGGKKPVVMGPTVQSVTPTAGATAVPVATLITATCGAPRSVCAIRRGGDLSFVQKFLTAFETIAGTA